MGLIKGKFITNIFKQIVPTGSINGTNKIFTLPSLPHSNEAVMVFVDGILRKQSADYTISDDTLSFNVAPVSGQSIICFYIER